MHYITCTCTLQQYNHFVIRIIEGVSLHSQTVTLPVEYMYATKMPSIQKWDSCCLGSKIIMKALHVASHLAIRPLMDENVAA